VAAVAPLLCVLATQAGGAMPPTLSFGARFTLAAGFQYDLGAGTSALGPDGTVWVAQPLSPSGGFEIAARTADGHTLHPGVAAGSSRSPPRLEPCEDHSPQQFWQIPRLSAPASVHPRPPPIAADLDAIVTLG
jgi:hypothetical protein